MWGDGLDADAEQPRHLYSVTAPYLKPWQNMLSFAQAQYKKARKVLEMLECLMGWSLLCTCVR